jgi:hypothetical protein
MKKLSNCNNIVITTLIIIGTFIVFFYLYVYGYKNEGFINFDGNQTVWDKKNDLENKLNDIKVSNQQSLKVPSNPVSSCPLLTTYGKDACLNGINKEKIKCKWNGSPTTYSGSSITMSTGGQCSDF